MIICSLLPPSGQTGKTFLDQVQYSDKTNGKLIKKVNFYLRYDSPALHWLNTMPQIVTLKLWIICQRSNTQPLNLREGLDFFLNTKTKP